MMMKRAAIALAILVLVLTVLLLTRNTFAATTRPAKVQPATTQSLEQQLAVHKLNEQKEFLAQVNPLPELKLPTGQISDLFDLYIEKDLILVRPKIDPTSQPMRCVVQGLAGPSTISVTPEHNAPGNGITALQFIHRDFSNPQEIFRHTMLFAHAGSVQLSMDLDSLVQSKSASLIEDMKPDDPERAVRINAQLIDPINDDLLGQYEVAAPTFRELRQRYPRETQEFVVPILRDLQSQSLLAPDPHLAVQVYQTAVKPDEPLLKKIDAALAKFDADSFQERQQAANDLKALGQSAALAIADMDRKGWSIDKQSGVDAFLSEYKSIPAEDVAKLRDDPVFLLDSLYSDNPAVRASAAERLSKKSGISIDPAAIGSARDATIDRVYSRLFAPLATQPSTKPD